MNIINIIRYVKNSGEAYSAKHIDIGYHSIEIDGIYHKGQRDCIKRLEFCKKEYNFKNKNVLDIGCCIGGMLFPLSSEINNGCGIDFNYRNINAGNAIKEYKKISNISFYIFDLDKEELEFIKNFIPKIDVVFLYSVCMWIKKWKKLIDFIASNSKVLFIETNGNPSEQLEQLNYCKLKFKIVKKLYDESLDDKGQHKRKLYICKNNI
jgi:SAM-dependent methyltransferase